MEQQTKDSLWAVWSGLVKMVVGLLWGLAIILYFVVVCVVWLVLKLAGLALFLLTFFLKKLRKKTQSVSAATEIAELQKTLLSQLKALAKTKASTSTQEAAATATLASGAGTPPVPVPVPPVQQTGGSGTPPSSGQQTAAAGEPPPKKEFSLRALLWPIVWLVIIASAIYFGKRYDWHPQYIWIRTWILKNPGQAIGSTVLLIPLYYALRMLFNVLAENDWLFTYRKEGQFRYIMKGEILHKIIYKLTDREVVQQTGKVSFKKGAGNEQDSLFEWIFGVVPVGLPPFKVKTWDFPRTRLLRPGDEQMGGVDFGYDIDEENEVVRRFSLADYLPLADTYAVVANELETFDNAKLTIVAAFKLEIHNCKNPIIAYQGKWFQYVEAAVKGAINRYVKQVTLRAWRENTDNDGRGPVIHYDEMMKMVIDETKTIAPTSNSGAVEIGVSVSELKVVDWQASSKIEDAAEAEVIAKMQANAAAAAADGQGRAIERLGTANAKAAKLLVDATTSTPGAVEIAKTKLLADALAASKVNALTILGGQSGVVPTLPVNAGTSAPVVPPVQGPA